MPTRENKFTQKPVISKEMKYSAPKSLNKKLQSFQRPQVKKQLESTQKKSNTPLKNKTELVNQIQVKPSKVPGQVFEREIFLSLSKYYIVKTTKYSGDGGIDGTVIIRGLEIPVSVKDENVGEPSVRDFIGALAGTDFKAGIIICSGKITRNAKKKQICSPKKLLILEDCEPYNIAKVLKNHLKP